jgi:hypothetical protein
MCCTQEPLPRVVKETIGLVVHLHGDMGTPIEIGMHLPLKTDGKGATGLTPMHDFKGNGLAALDQVMGVAQGDNRFRHVQ